MKPINVKSEIGELKKILLHRPGFEVENLTPDLLERLLFDDIPYLKVAREEHDAFAKALEQEGVEVVYIEELITQTLETDNELKLKFIEQFINEAGVYDSNVLKTLQAYFLGFDTKDMIDKMIAGVRNHEVDVENLSELDELIATSYPFITDPLPNLYFQRDPFASIGNGVSIHRMHTETRNRETIFADYIFNYHPDYQGAVDIYYERTKPYSLEGGDILNISDKMIAVGISQRSELKAIEELAHKLFFDTNTNYEAVLAFDIPKSRAFMHLDTVFTQIDYDKFTIHPNIIDKLTVYELTKQDQEITINVVSDTLENILEKYLGIEVQLILCGDGDEIAAGREQWNDGANTLCIRPGVVVVYERNWVTNAKLKEMGIKVIEIPSSELSRGRGGPRCMSMPLVREDL